MPRLCARVSCIRRIANEAAPQAVKFCELGRWKSIPCIAETCSVCSNFRLLYNLVRLIKETNGYKIMNNTTHIQRQPITTSQTSAVEKDDIVNSSVLGGLSVRTDLRAGLAWDDLDDQAQTLWNNLTNAVSSLTGGTEANS